jgi:hypothetical protein
MERDRERERERERVREGGRERERERDVTCSSCARMRGLEKIYSTCGLEGLGSGFRFDRLGWK